MTKDQKSIYIKNIYYMLSYAFQVLKHENYEDIAAEEFDEIEDLFAEILSKGVSRQLKQGLYREYVSKTESMPLLRGKLEMRGTIKHRLAKQRLLSCEYDELSENNIYNQILKTTMFYLLKAHGVNEKRKELLKKEIVFFDGIDTLTPSEIRWNQLYYHRNSATYELLINLCYFVLDGMLQTTEKGEYHMAGFSDEHMATLYEKFILEYYIKEHKELDDVRAGAVKWNLFGDHSERQTRQLPSMQTDVMIKKGEKTLIIDAKYYGKSLQNQFDKATVCSNNVYQIYSYVKNYDKGNTGNVSGVLLYAKTDEEITPDMEVNIDNNWISANSLDLSVTFTRIAGQLDDILVHEFSR